jgi:uncharacterized protein (TIGR00730 family)
MASALKIDGIPPPLTNQQQPGSPTYPTSSSTPTIPEVVCIQPVAIVDHVCSVKEEALLQLIGSDKHDIGGSRLVNLKDLQHILFEIGEYFSKAGGSSANTTRALASFGVKSKLVGARGSDEFGAIFAASMRRAGVDISGVRTKKSFTGRCAVLSCISNGQRTMRTCLEGAARLDAEELKVEDLRGAKMVYLSGYCFYTTGLVDKVCALGKECEGLELALDLGSYEVVRNFYEPITALIESGCISIVFCNEDEAAELITGQTPKKKDATTTRTTGDSLPEEALAYLSQYCKISVVTLGEKGCLVKSNNEGAAVIAAVPAVTGIKAVDTTGAGDVFAAGFLFSVLRNYSIHRAAEIGCLAGAAVVQTLGAEMTAVNIEWLHARIFGEHAGSVVRDSACAVQQELLACYALIEQHGRGVVYYGSARLKEDSPHWEKAVKLGNAVASLLQCTTWSGGGPGMMQAATLGAIQAQGKVAGIRIQREAGSTVRSAGYLPTNAAVVCRFLSSRKVALVDAGVRNKEEDKTAYIFLPGGLGSMDEFFEILTLVQLKKLGTKYSVPLILVDWDGYYSGLMAFLLGCVKEGTVGAAELRDVIIAKSNQEVVNALSVHYGLVDQQSPRARIARASSWLTSMHIKNGD